MVNAVGWLTTVSPEVYLVMYTGWRCFLQCKEGGEGTVKLEQEIHSIIDTEEKTVIIELWAYTLVYTD